jgi:hypothetical protein
MIETPAFATDPERSIAAEACFRGGQLSGLGATSGKPCGYLRLRRDLSAKHNTFCVI